MSAIEESDTQHEAELAALLTEAGKRPEPALQVQQTAYRALHTEWQQKVRLHRQQRQRRWVSVMSVAAVVTLTLSVGLLWMPQSDSVMRVHLASGDLTVNGVLHTQDRSLELPLNSRLQAHTAVRLTTAEGADMRLAEGSLLAWQDLHNLHLDAGSVYIDTHERSDFTIKTAFGSVRDIGTRFLVATDTNAMQVAVREGAAQVHSDFGQYTARAQPLEAAVLQVTTTGMTPSTETTAHPRWDWIHAVSAGYEEQTVPALLHAIGRDLGKPITWANRGVEVTLANATVSGQLQDLPPRAALQLVSRSAGLKWQEFENRIDIDFN